MCASMTSLEYECKLTISDVILFFLKYTYFMFYLKKYRMCIYGVAN